MPESQKKPDISGPDKSREESQGKKPDTSGPSVVNNEEEEKRGEDIPGRREIDRLKNELLLLKQVSENNLLEMNKGLMRIIEISLGQMHTEIITLEIQFKEMTNKMNNFMEKAMWETEP